jgi:DNA-binding winged helix-turn-helix (wHTH) protein
MLDRTQSTLTLYDALEANHRMCLVVVWHRDDPDQLGALCFLPASGTVHLGRASDDNLIWFRHTPENRPGPRCQPTQSPRISRQQLAIHPTATGLQVDNLGRCGLRLNGHSTKQGTAGLGTVIEIEREVSFLVTERPTSFPAVPGYDHPFGTPDVFGFVGESPDLWDLRHQISATRAGSGHVVIRGAEGTDRERVARALDATPYRWQDGASPPDTPLWVADPCAWFSASAKDALALLRNAKRAGQRVVISLQHDEDLAFSHLSHFPMRIDVPGLETLRPDLPFLAHHMLTELKAETPRAALCFQEGKAQFSPDWIQFLATRSWTANTAELRVLLVEAIHRTTDGWLRPPRTRAQATQTVDPSVLEFSTGTADLDHRVILRDGQRHALTPMEVKLLRYLGARPGREVTKRDLLVEVWSYKPTIETQAIENTIRRLRKKLEPNPKDPIHLVSVWGVGYRLDLDGK